jgi:hypothetical protein
MTIVAPVGSASRSARYAVVTGLDPPASQFWLSLLTAGVDDMLAVPEVPGESKWK